MSQHPAHHPPATVGRPRAVDDGVRPAADALGRPSGPAAAVVLAAGLSSFALGLLSVLAAASVSVSDALTLSERVGELSGLTTAAGIVFFAVWAVLGFAWRRADPPLPRVAAAASVLIALGVIGTFPPFFNLIGG
jgi:hypothetical protein